MPLARTLLTVSLFASSCIGLLGCESGKLSGRVVPGPGNVVSVVEEEDPRFKIDGIGGTNVVIRRYVSDGQPGAIVASGISEPNGAFKLSMKNLDDERNEMVVTATTPDKRISRGRIFFPAAGKQILVVVREDH